MDRRKIRMARQTLRQSRSRSRSRSRSATPGHDRHSQPSLARRSLLQQMVISSVARDPDFPTSPPRFRALNVERTPGGSMNLTGMETELFKTPGGSIKQAVTFLNSALERAEEMDIADDEVDEVLARNPQHLTNWLPELAAEDSAVVCAADVARPSTSGIASGSGSGKNPRVDEGSDFDSDWDDEFSTVPIEATVFDRDIPESLEGPLEDIINDVGRGIDDEIDRRLGSSTNFEWHADFETFRGTPEQFSGPTPGPLKNYDSAYDAFVDIWDKEIIDRIVIETNRYAQQAIDEMKAKGTMSRGSRLHRWVPTNADEIMVFFAIIQYMGISPRTSLNEYWTKGVLGMREFRSLMAYDRYILLNKFLHFVDNSEFDNFEMPQSGAIGSAKVLSRRLFKLSPIIAHLGKKFDTLYQLSRHVAIDESLTLFKGRLNWVQTIRSKAARFGIKSYELCESQTGYMARFQIYTGKDDASSASQVGVDFGLKSATTVLELLQGLEHRGHCVTMDNFYNCPSLARHLKSLGFDCLGTFRPNRRYVPPEVASLTKGKPKPRGYMISRHSGDLSIVSWMDAKMVNIISTYHNADTYVGSRAGKACVKPVSVKDYNTYMGAVDVKDQKLSMYLLERKRGVKWYIKMFKRLMNVSILNSLVMYTCCQQRRGQPPITHREFRYELANSLIAKHRGSQLKIQGPVGDLIRLNRNVVHNPKYVTGSNARRRCRVCYARGRKIKLSRLCCVTCDAFMCQEGCWEAWHSAPDLNAHEGA